jgi:hypothetical protein
MPEIVTDEPPKQQAIPQEIVEKFSPEIIAAIEAMQRMARVKKTSEQYSIRPLVPKEYTTEP